jgi:DNA mismatch repair ATPase MutS
MNKNDIKNIYKDRIETYRQETTGLKKIAFVMSILKFMIIFAVIFFLFRKELSLPLLGGFLLVFVFLSIIHEKNVNKQKWQKLLCKINENEIQYLNNKFPSTDNGSYFFDEEHRYAEDMDIFSERGLFHYLNRAKTMPGKSLLAEWLKEHSDVGEIKRRQGAVRELSRKMDFRQTIQAFSMDIDDTSKNVKAIYNLFKEPFFILRKKFFIIYFHLFPLLTLAAIVSIFFNVPWGIALSFVLVQILVNHFTGEQVARIYQYTTDNCKILKAYTNIIREIENQSFESEELSFLHGELSGKEQPASKYINRLSNLSAMFELRLNSLFYFIFNNTLSWDFHCIYRIEKLINSVRSDIHKWLNAAGKVEALCSFANLYFNHPSWTMPGFSEKEFKLEALSLGHPLIPECERVSNDIKFERDGRVLIVTGPNMAGKSTFLRTLGVNLALTFAGAPVCAKHFVISPVKLYSSMKLSDSLDKKLSLFYTELQHLKKILDGIIRGEPVFFIIDEMLKGTNTKDRQQGAIALIKQLIRYDAHGIIATHDLELANIEKEYPIHIINCHFDGFVEGDKLLFDYKLRRGVCRSFNALTLMRKIGIQL